MNTKTMGTAERFGRWLGRLWRSYVCREKQVAGWLVVRGMPAGGATILLWIVKLVVLGVLLYVVFWLALLLLFAIAVACAARNAEWETPKPEWKNGLSGYGLYTHDGYRIDPHVSDDD